MEERKGYTFGGWYVDPELTKRLNPGGILPHQMTLYDKWTLDEYTITYELNGGVNSQKNPHTVTVESGLIKLYPAYREDKIFVGWTLNGRPISLIPAGVYCDITLVANFKSLPKVIFETRGGGRIRSKTVSTDKLLKPFRPPVKIGYEFENWYWDNQYQQVYTFDQPIENSCILYAKWKVKVFQIEYETNGGTSARLNPKTYTYFDDTFFLKPAYKKGHKFLGWFDIYGNKQEAIFKHSLGNKKLTAKFKKILD